MRFGGGKLFYEVGGESMIARALRLYSSVPCSVRVCVTRGEEQALQRLALESGFAVAINPDPERGVGTSVAIGTEAALRLEPDLDGILYAVSDQPYLEPASVGSLLEAFTRNPERIVSLAYQGERGNPAVFPNELFNELTALGGDVGGGAVLRRHPEKLLLVEAGSKRELDDLDTRNA